MPWAQPAGGPPAVARADVARADVAISAASRDARSLLSAGLLPTCPAAAGGAGFAGAGPRSGPLSPRPPMGWPA